LLVDEPTAAKLLGVSARTLFSMRQRGEIPFVRVSFRVLYSPAALVAWIEARQSIPQVES
jgi:excisionase family DNA binding protein